MTQKFLADIKQNPDRYYIIHYSSQSLYDAGIDRDGMSPRITSIVVMHFPTRQTVAFSMHAIAEEKRIAKTEIEVRYDEIELQIITRFYDFIRERRDKYWIHWQMKNIVFGFEHIEHRFRVLSASDSSPPQVPVEFRINLDTVIKDKFGNEYASNPRMLNLMLLNGSRDHRFMTGDEEAKAFKAKEFIRMNSSTISKVEFFAHVLSLILKGKLKTDGKQWRVRLDRIMESQLARLVAFVVTVITFMGLIWALFVELYKYL